MPEQLRASLRHAVHGLTSGSEGDQSRESLVQSALDTASQLLQIVASAGHFVPAELTCSRLHHEALEDIGAVISAMAEAAHSLSDPIKFNSLTVPNGHHNALAYRVLTQKLEVAFASLIKLMQFDKQEKIVPDVKDGVLICSSGTVYRRKSSTRDPSTMT